ncbi:hypothetical protein [Micromonospora sp. NPDC023633]|uniref:hypothetical protein n=1 Tax=Micromonospora sp. NPDC023633 TaxID=3154320 RepID=UPI0033C392D3
MVEGSTVDEEGSCDAHLPTSGSARSTGSDEIGITGIGMGAADKILDDLEKFLIA